MVDRQEFNLAKLSQLTEAALASLSNDTTRKNALNKRRKEIREFRDIAESLVKSFPEVGETQQRPLLDKLTRPVTVEDQGRPYQYKVAQYAMDQETYRFDTFILEVRVPDSDTSHNLFSVEQEWRLPPLARTPTVSRTIARNYFGKIASSNEVEDALHAIRGVANLLFQQSKSLNTSTSLSAGDPQLASIVLEG